MRALLSLQDPSWFKLKRSSVVQQIVGQKIIKENKRHQKTNDDRGDNHCSIDHEKIYS